MKKILITLNDLFNLPTAVIYNPDGYKPASSVSIDSRNIVEGSVFVAIKGDRFDGHDFVKEAVKKGAGCVIINEKNYSKFNNLSISIVTVSDTNIALGNLAKVWRSKLETKIIAITGSAGKTTTKEILSDLLSEKFTVNKTSLNNNNHIGVPLTILSTNNKHDVLVLELGTNHFGEIAYTSKITQPDYAVITNIGNSHLEFLKNKKGVYKEKIELFNVTAGRQGFLFINNDDELLAKSFNGYSKKITFAFKHEADVKGNVLGYSDYGNPIIEIKYKNKNIKQVIPLYGEQSAKNFLTAVTIALKLGVNKTGIESALNKIKAVDKRLNVREYKNFLLIDDTYNANPESMKSSFELLGKVNKFKRKIAVIGDMFELGGEAEKLHIGLAGSIKKNNINTVFTIGKMMKRLNNVLSSSKIETKHFTDREKLKKVLSNFDFSNSVVLVKGSRGMKMEEFVKVIEAEANE